MSVFTGNIVLDIVVLIVTIITGIIAYFKYKYTYWDKRGLFALEPTMPFGSVNNFFRGKCTFSEQMLEIHHKIKAKGLKHAGFYFGWAPAYAPVDLDIIKHILQTDFQHFLNHGGFNTGKHDPLNGHLFNLTDARWRNMRVKLTPTFTSGKMKMMFQTLTNCSDGMEQIMDYAANMKEPLDIKDVITRFTTDVIGSCAFGIECNSLKDPNSDFLKYGKRVAELNVWDRIKFFCMIVFPDPLLEFFRFKFTKSDVENFFMDVITKTVEYREKNNIYRKDFMHLLLQLKNRGLVADDEKIHDVGEQSNTTEHTITLNELAAQCYLFFNAGYETSSTAVTLTFLELALNQEIQDKLRGEIVRVLDKHDGQITYAAIVNEMTYLDQVFNETLRKYPPIPFLPRECTKDYIIPGTTIRIEKGAGIIIPLMGIHHDPEYYPDPEKFDPERFSEENKKTRPSLSFMPFGEGPRACIGLRFALMQSKVAIVTLLKNYRIRLNGKTKVPIQMTKRKFSPEVDGGVWLSVEKTN